MAETSKTADHALAVLLELSERGPMAPAEIARRLELNRTVVHRLLSTLHQRGFIHRSESGYVPGTVLVRMAERVQPALRAAAARPMTNLCDELRETIVLHVADGQEAVVLEERVAGGHVLRVEHDIGSRQALDRGASGRALLAFLPRKSRARAVRRGADPEDLTRELDQVIEMGYAISHDELQNGVHGLAVPVLDGEGHAIASLALSVPARRAEGLQRHVELLRSGAAAIVESLYGDSAGGVLSAR
jgi:DNA-binding IclR family transcriptional regulator